ncbi:hypothetical protein [Wenyingzhuangia sp. 2_MG-2023]|uniref:hypothetical protein n=1 Tax=Wenyingzhuangia sp. 2_MG-2023 TaxID=3062639 RepID=UPI0026E38FE1|nr:hypothetical protein [Wenyingzhuangia sp. 2_MG-2023]MDO6739472.1 hypothetical protein [Wenyingzhuangia sp. 2_MG-2023]
MVLLSMEIGGFDFYANNQTAFSFVLSEMTMMFTVNYTKNDELIRSIMESEEMNEDEGEPFEFEKNEDDKSKLIYHLIEKTLGESFHNIDLEAKCFRYSFKQETVAEEKNTQLVEVKNEQTNQNKKPWWKFW